MAAEALEQSVLESKDKDQLLAIAKALGLKASTRTKKSDIIDQILETTGSPSLGAVNGSGSNGEVEAIVDVAPAPAPEAVAVPVTGDGDEPPAEWELAVGDGDDASGGTVAPATEAAIDDDVTAAANEGLTSAPAHRNDDQRGGRDRQQQQSQHGGAADEGEGRNRRRRRRRKGGARGTDGPQGDDATVFERETVEPAGSEVVEVSGYLDMRDEGYGFLRVNGYLPSRDDAYIPVKLARQYGLRKGDHVSGLSRPAARNEKNPALLEIHTVNGGDPEAAKRRPRFEDLTALFPDEKLKLENAADPTNMTARIIDLVAPIGKGQRGHHRVAAEGWQDVRDEDDRHLDRGQQSRGQADHPAHRRAP